MEIGLYQSAKAHLDTLLKYNLNEVTRKRTELLLKQAVFCCNAIKNPVPFNPVNLGENINTELKSWAC